MRVSSPCSVCVHEVSILNIHEIEKLLRIYNSRYTLLYLDILAINLVERLVNDGMVLRLELRAKSQTIYAVSNVNPLSNGNPRKINRVPCIKAKIQAIGQTLQLPSELLLYWCLCLLGVLFEGNFFPSAFWNWSCTDTSLMNREPEECPSYFRLHGPKSYVTLAQSIEALSTTYCQT